MKYILQNPFKIIFMLFVSAFLGVFILFSQSSLEKAKEEIRSDVLNWNYEISESFHNEQSADIAKKIAVELREKPVSSFSFFHGETEMVAWPEVEKNPSDVCHKVEFPLTLAGGIQVGHFQACVSESRVLMGTLYSPLFLALLLVFGGLVIVAGVYPLFGYKKSQKNTVELLRKWKENPGNVSDLQSSDKLTQEVVGLVVAGIRSQTELNAIKSELASEKRFSEEIQRAAHDIQSPVNRLIKRLKSLENLGEADYFGFQKNLKALLDLSDDLRMRKLELNKCDFQPISKILQAEIVEKRSEAPNLKIESDIEENLDALCSLGNFERLISNILNNAIEACGDTGAIQVVAKRNGDAGVKIEVTDTGIGIPLSKQHRVFMENFTFGKTSGSGLGLFFAKKKVEEWGGKIFLSSIPDEGTTITVELSSENKVSERKSG